jgi:hypothetical protein
MLRCSVHVKLLAGVALLVAAASAALLGRGSTLCAMHLVQVFQGSYRQLQQSMFRAAQLQKEQPA